MCLVDASPAPLRCLTIPLQVEKYYISSGYLIPSFHKHYWLGLTTQKQGGRPNWYWLEPNAGSPLEDEVYKHWGMYQVGGGWWAGRQAGQRAWQHPQPS